MKHHLVVTPLLLAVWVMPARAEPVIYTARQYQAGVMVDVVDICFEGLDTCPQFSAGTVKRPASCTDKRLSALLAHMQPPFQSSGLRVAPFEDLLELFFGDIPEKDYGFDGAVDIWFADCNPTDNILQGLLCVGPTVDAAQVNLTICTYGQDFITGDEN